VTDPKTESAGESTTVFDRFHDRRERFLERWHERRAAHHAKRDARHARRDERHARRDELRTRAIASRHARHPDHRHHPQRPTLPTTVKESFHLLLNLPIGIATFTILVTAISTGLSTLVIIIGFPILVGTGIAVRWIANLERARVRWLLGADDLLPATWPGEGEPLLRRLWTCTKDPTVWKEAFYELVLMPWGIATFTITVVLWSFAFAGTFFSLWVWALPDSQPWYEIVGFTLAGLTTFVVGPWIIHGVALLGRAMSRALLGVSTRELSAKVEHLSASRKQTVDAATAERQRIERALHDGAQVRLTALAMELGRAKEKLDNDPEGAKELLDQAHDDAKRALVELRDLARGIHPAILTDRGLDAALGALAAR
jgi:signal transduction histidine kinase